MRRLLSALLLAATTMVLLAGEASALASVTVTPITFNVIGLDSNDVTSGPNVFPVGARICASGEDATGVTATFTWDSANPLLQLEGSDRIVRARIAAGSCADVFFNVVVTRTAAAYLTSRSFHIGVTFDGGGSASTPVPRELFVEKLISQERNSVNTFVGPSTVTVGDTVTYTVDADTAPGGYAQLEAFLRLPSSSFELLSVQTSYGAPSGAFNDTVYADACGWDADPTSATYRSCVGPERYPGGKAGGDVITTFTVRAVGAGTLTLSAAIYDQSGSSYHYNSDFGRAPNALVVTVVERANAPAPTTPAAPTPPAAPADLPVAPAAPTAPQTSAPAAPAPAVAPPPAVATGSPAPRAPRVGNASSSPLAATGGQLAAGGSIGVLVTLLGFLLLGGLRAVPPPLPATRLQQSVHQLRIAFYGHEDDPDAAKAWPLLDALDRAAAALPEPRDR